ncbi:MAG TPA: ABC transporter ATP-binding protein [Thermodesulfobacteriota bacterium]|nr:ABC transporter ATP-binding protein [Thermodesulfobacteriota bacterium]
MILKAYEIHSFYAKSHILQGVSINLEQGNLVCLLGRNGVGKTTTLKSIMGMVKPAQGSILFKGREIVGRQPYEIARLGIGIVPEDRRIFPSLTVQENLLMGIVKRPDNLSGEERWYAEKVYDLFPRLKERMKQKGGHLSGGEQQMLTMGRTLMGNPELILIDEPTEGLAPKIVALVTGVLAAIHLSGTTLLIVEQNYKSAIKFAERFYIMSKGQVVFEGGGETLIQAEGVRKRYLEV